MKIKPTAETIWKRPAYLQYVHSPLNDDVVATAEKQLGCVFPQSFIELLRVQNGGPIRFRIPESPGGTIAGIGPSFPSVTNFDLSDHQEYVDFALDGLVAFDGDGHWYHCLDFRSNGKEPSVCYVDVECNSQYQIATNFTSFLDLMELDLEREMVLSGVENMHDAKSRLEALFNRAFEEKVSNLGVTYFKCKTGRQWDSCFWISGNRVARSYSGEAPGPFQYEGNALLFPELDPDAVIFETPQKYLETFNIKLGKARLSLVDVNVAWLS